MKYQITPALVQFNDEGYSIKAGWALIYNADPVTGEFQNVTYEYIAEGLKMPDYVCMDAPIEQEEGLAIIRKNDKWIYLNDYRGQKIYSKETGYESMMQDIGDIPYNYTLLKPNSKFDIWNGEKWVLDTEKQHQYYIELAKEEKAELIREATEQITYLQDAIDAEIATDEEVAACEAWKKYRVLLNRIDINDAPNINWPQKPL